jgi:hypothetical protein
LWTTLEQVGIDGGGVGALLRDAGDFGCGRANLNTNVSAWSVDARG